MAGWSTSVLAGAQQFAIWMHIMAQFAFLKNMIVVP